MTMKKLAFAILGCALLAPGAGAADKPSDCYYGDGSDEALAALTVNTTLDAAGAVHRSVTWQLPKAGDGPGLMTFDYEVAGKAVAAPTGLLNVSTSDVPRAAEVAAVDFTDARLKVAVVRRGDAGFTIASAVLDAAAVAKVIAGAGPARHIRATILTADGTAIAAAAFDAAQPPDMAGTKAQEMLAAARDTDCSRKIDAFKAGAKPR